MSDMHTRAFHRKQDACKESGGRYYGNGGTIHGTPHLDIETDAAGRVVGVWFRCQPIPFQQVTVDEGRAAEMRRMYSENMVGVMLCGVEIKDAPVSREPNAMTFVP